MHFYRNPAFTVAAAALALLILLPLGSRASPAQDDIQVEVSRNGDNVLVHAQLSVPVSAQQAYSVLTDYDHMQQFLPGLEKSQILKHLDKGLLVAQSGRAALGPFSMPFDYVRRIELQPGVSLVSHIVSGSIKRADVTTTLKEAKGQTLITYDSDATMSIWLPFGIGNSAIASHIRDQLDSMRKEMLRRRSTASSS
jgi:carbon monoxide dehydrogenase subunit G